jgi:hypothetical protein
MLTGRGFKAAVLSRISAQEGKLEWFIEAYAWAREHIKIIRKYWPEFSNGWLFGEIRRMFNVNAHAYVRAAMAFGDGAEDRFHAGSKIIGEFGVAECTRAEKLLTREQLLSVRDGIRGGAIKTQEALRRAVDKHVVEPVERSQARDEEFWRKKYLAAVEELRRVKKENQRLRAALGKLCFVETKEQKR